MKPGEFKLRSVRKGDTYAKAVVGGVVRTDVTDMGVVVETEECEFLVPVTALVARLRELGFTVTA